MHDNMCMMNQHPLTPRKCAYAFVQGLPQEILEHHIHAVGEPPPLFDPKAVEVITDGIMEFIAEIVAYCLDAGAERDAVMENDTMREAIETELKGW